MPEKEMRIAAMSIEILKDVKGAEFPPLWAKRLHYVSPCFPFLPSFQNPRTWYASRGMVPLLHQRAAKETFLDNAISMLYKIPMTGKELLRLLEKNGWALDRVKGSHHILFKENKTISVPVHGSKDLGKGLLNKLLQEGGLKK